MENKFKNNQQYAKLKSVNNMLFDNRISIITPLLNKKELAQLLNISVKTIDKWVSAGKIPHFKVGGKVVRFERKSIETWLLERSNHGN